MLHCVLYVFLGGTAMINSGCALEDEYVLVDKIQYVSEPPPDYPISGYKVYYSTPSIVWNSPPTKVKSYHSSRVRTHYYYPRGYYGYYPKRRHRRYYPRKRYRPHTKKVKMVKPHSYKKQNKKYKKKRRK